jgi:hypothetical protein
VLKLGTVSADHRSSTTFLVIYRNSLFCVTYIVHFHCHLFRFFKSFRIFAPRLLQDKTLDVFVHTKLISFLRILPIVTHGLYLSLDDAGICKTSNDDYWLSGGRLAPIGCTDERISQMQLLIATEGRILIIPISVRRTME